MERLSVATRLIDQAYEAIVDAVCSGDLKPGERLTQELIAARLDVSRQPVTHALAMAKKQGFLSEVGRGRLVVAPVDPQQLQAIHQFRSAVEPLAVRLATPHLTSEAIEQGRSIIARARQIIPTGNTKTLLHADVDFHSFVYTWSGNSVIVETMALNWQHIRRAMSFGTPYAEVADVWDEHESVLDAMAEGNANLAAERMYAHTMHPRGQPFGLEPELPAPAQAGQADQVQ
jgi:DNA-binding GntR family transcriptional regulator